MVGHMSACLAVVFTNKIISELQKIGIWWCLNSLTWWAGVCKFKRV